MESPSSGSDSRSRLENSSGSCSNSPGNGYAVKICLQTVHRTFDPSSLTRESSRLKLVEHLLQVIIIGFPLFLKFQVIDGRKISIFFIIVQPKPDNKSFFK